MQYLLNIIRGWHPKKKKKGEACGIMQFFAAQIQGYIEGSFFFFFERLCTSEEQE